MSIKVVAYFKTRKDAEEHMKKFAPKGRVVEFGNRLSCSN